MTDAPISSQRLKSFIERVEKLNEEIRAIMQDRRDVFGEAKGVGYDVKTMRKVIALRAMDAADRAEQETLLDTYWHALTQIDRVEARVASGESIRTAAKAEGMPKSTAIRQVTQNRSNVENGSDDSVEGGVVNLVRDGGAPVATSTVGPAATTIAVASVKPGDKFTLSPELAAHYGLPSDAVLAVEDDLEPPSFLKRERVA